MVREKKSIVNCLTKTGKRKIEMKIYWKAVQVINGCAGQLFVQTVLEIVCLWFFFIDNVTGFFSRLRGGNRVISGVFGMRHGFIKKDSFSRHGFFKDVFFLRHGFFFCVRRAENLEGVIICSREEGKRIY